MIEEGLVPTDRVILTNLQRIRPKDEVQLKPAAEPGEKAVAAGSAGGVGDSIPTRAASGGAR